MVRRSTKRKMIEMTFEQFKGEMFWWCVTWLAITLPLLFISLIKFLVSE